MLTQPELSPPVDESVLHDALARYWGYREFRPLQRAAIAANRQRPNYLRQPPPYDPDKLVIKRKRFSTTQGEVLLTYDGQRIEQYGDTIRLDGRGNYEGHDDHYWHDIAKRDLARRHVEVFDRSMIAREALPPT